jgi:uncharacterized protein DUF2652
MKGLIFIPDISGFTEFVWNVPQKTGAAITRELLNEIIDNSLPGLKLAEVEGDSLLFYKLGAPYPLAQMLDLFKKMAAAFTARYHSLQLLYNVKASLSIKFILHYGDIDTYKIRRFEKLYGKAVVESHRLLKNGFNGSDYLLITEDYLSASESPLDSLNHFTIRPERVTQYFSNLRDINYFFYSRGAFSQERMLLTRDIGSC